MFAKFLKKSNCRRGFSLVEVIIALFIVMVGIFGAYSLVSQSLAAANSASMRLTAVYLAREGIEIARNIRDTNYLRMRAGGASGIGWSDGLMGCDGEAGCGADYTHHSLSDTYAGRLLNFNGRYNYAPADPVSNPETLFKRSIRVVPMGNYLQVIVSVEWSQRGSVQELTAQENIYNWWEM